MGKEAKHRDKLGMDMKRLCIWAVGGGCSRNEAVETHTNPHFIGYIGGGIRRIKKKIFTNRNKVLLTRGF